MPGTSAAPVTYAAPGAYVVAPTVGTYVPPSPWMAYSAPVVYPAIGAPPHNALAAAPSARTFAAPAAPVAEPMIPAPLGLVTHNAVPAAPVVQSVTPAPTTFATPTAPAALAAPAAETIKATAVDTQRIVDTRGHEREQIAKAMIERTGLKTQTNGWKTAVDGWRANRHTIQAPVSDALKEKYLTTLANARSHIALPQAASGHHRRAEMYAYAVAIVQEYIHKTENYFEMPHVGEEEKRGLLNSIAGMKQNLSELYNLLGEKGELTSVELPDDSMQATRHVTQAQAFVLGGEAAAQALELRRPDGGAANAEAMGACLFWYAKNMLASGSDGATMLTVLQQAWEKFSLLDLPEDHFRKVQVRKMITDLENGLHLTVQGGAVEREALPAASSEEDARLCIICCEQPRDAALQCGHLCACSACAAHMSACPICRAAITEIRQVFIA